jgi:type IV secretion system protein VirB9
MKKFGFKKVVMLALSLSMLTSMNTYAYELPANPIAGDVFEADNFIQDSYDAKGYMMEVLFAYAPEQVYKIYLQQGFVTDIRLAMDEVVEYVGAGDTVRWKLDTIKSDRVGEGPHVLVKPVQDGISTNLVINTNKRSYHLLLISGDGFNPMVKWEYPKPDIEVIKERETKTYTRINPANLKFGFSISNKSLDWAPADVFRSELKTYLKMKPEVVNTDLPTLFVVDDDERLVLTSFRYLNGYIIVDRLFDRAILLAGKKKVKIRYRGG